MIKLSEDIDNLKNFAVGSVLQYPEEYDTAMSALNSEALEYVAGYFDHRFRSECPVHFLLSHWVDLVDYAPIQG